MLHSTFISVVCLTLCFNNTIGIFSVFYQDQSGQLQGKGLHSFKGAHQWSSKNLTLKANENIKRVHIVYMNHLDVGFANLVNNILNEYFVTYFPRAIKVADDLLAGGYVETFTYTTHPWLVSLYMDCPPNLVLSGIKLLCPDKVAKAAFIRAVNKGYITWHAGPMNLQMEMAQQWLLEFGVNLAVDLDKTFNVTRTSRTLSQRDVPGLTIGALPVLLDNNIIAISVGVNSGTPPPAVPPLFVWKFNENDSGIMGNWHPGGYPNNPGSSPSSPGGLSRGDCLVVQGLEEALCFAFRTDNSGPPVNATEVLGYYEILRAEFPRAVLKASRLEEYFEAAKSIINDLPIITKEIGDTWISGVASDPRKCAEYRTVSRILGACIDKGSCVKSDARVWNSSRLLLKVTEHTWGIDSAHDTEHWSNSQFLPLRDTASNLIRCRMSWEEQREFVYLSIDALQDHSVVNQIRSELKKLTPTLPDLHDYTSIADLQHSFICPTYNTQLQFGADGSITKLVYKDMTLVSPFYPLGYFQYSTYNETDFIAFSRQYSYDGWEPGYTKKNITQNAHPDSAHWPVRLNSLYAYKASPCRFYVSLEMIDSVANTYYGAPQTIWIHYNFTEAGIDVDLQWFNKTSTRLPEAMFFNLNFVPQTKSWWFFHKVAMLVSPSSVILNGSQHHHALGDEGAWYMDSKGRVARIISIDLPISSPITASKSFYESDIPKRSTSAPLSPYPIPLHPITTPITGVAFNLFNNVWDCNWIFWYPFLEEDKDFRARFHIDFD